MADRGPFRQNQDQNAQRWRQRWLEGQTGWDLGRPHPFCEELFDRARIEAGLVGFEALSALVPGCGQGHEASYTAQLGVQTLGVDVAPEAIDAAIETYGHVSGLKFSVCDMLARPDESGLKGGGYDLVVDRAMLCALDAEQRKTYLQLISHLMPAGGLFLGILFAAVAISPAKGPPYALSDRQLWELFQRDFDLVCLDRLKSETLPAIQEEWVAVWRKK